ncbi:MAG: beta-lactamase family protein [Anaerolineales bacterium]|nr:beta-lactamase family protein [Anaerolineales bacterium]
MKTHKPFILTMLLLLTLGGVGCRQQIDAYDAINAELQSAFAADAPGVALYVKAPGVGKQLFSAGLANVESGKKMRSDAMFRIGALTQPFTSTLLLQLIEEGVVSLDDTLDRWLPPEMLDQLANGRQATIRQLLTMTSGIPDYTQNPDFQTAYAANPSHAWTPEEAVAYAYGRAAEFAPGASFSPSNTNYLLLQMVAEAVTGETLAYTIRDRFLYRLDLDETYLERAEDLPEGHLPGYSAAGRVLNEHEGKGLGDDGLVSTTIDLAQFVPALASRQLSGANADFTHQTSDMGSGLSYGPGVMQWETEWGTLWGYEGQTKGFSGSMWYLPEQKITLVALANDETYGPALATLLNDVLALVAAPQP